VYGLNNDRADSVVGERFLCLFKDLVGLAIPSPSLKTGGPVRFHSVECRRESCNIGSRISFNFYTKN
jgi:hypothetical protein